MKKQTLRIFDGKALIADLKRKISEYSIANKAGDQHFMQTFRSGLTFLNQVETTVYNEENKSILQGASDQSPELFNIFTRIDQNNKHMYEIETGLNVFFQES